MSQVSTNNLATGGPLHSALDQSAQSAEPVDKPTLYAETVGHVGGFPVTNAWLSSGLAVLIVCVIALAIRKKVTLVPKKLQTMFEIVIEQFLNIADGITNSRSKSLQFAPLILSLFFFILINNWLGMLPGVNSIGQVILQNGQKVFVPYLRGGTADLNTTLALATMAVVVSHICGVVAVGWWKYLNKFVNIKAFLDIPKKIVKDPTVVLVNPIHAFVGIIEIVGELAKIASLSFRLFGNVFAGEVLLAAMSAILAFALPVPFMFLEIVVGLIQALIFAILVLIYLSISTTAEEH